MPRFHWTDAIPKDVATGEAPKSSIFEKDPIMEDIAVRDRLKVLAKNEGKERRKLTDEELIKLYQVVEGHKRITEQKTNRRCSTFEYLYF